MADESKPLVAEATVIGSTDKGRWKSGIFECFKHGIFHPALLCACITPRLLMGQLLTRMKMTWLGIPTSASEEIKKTFPTVMIIAFCNYLIVTIYSCVDELDEVIDLGEGKTVVIQHDNCPAWQSSLTSWVTFAFGIYVLVVLIRLRMAIRSKYQIPEENCVGYEDCCCAAFCGCCALVQMAHQTADYDNEDAYFLSTTGLAVSEDGNEGMERPIIV